MLPIAPDLNRGTLWCTVKVCVSVLVLLLCVERPAAAQPLPALIPYNAGGLWGYADSAGRVRIAPQWITVQFFSRGRAMVTLPSEPGRRATLALIDSGGRYIIPPEIGWTGAWGGSWGKTELNAADSSGRLGLVDFDGRLLIPREWASGYRMQGALEDSFRIVHRNGFAGIVDRHGRIVEPVKWGAIGSDETLSAIRAFRVTDPDNTAGNNSIGIADLSGHLLIPPRYSHITLNRSVRGELYFEVGRAASNERTTGDAGGGYGSRKFFAYPSLRQIPDPGKALPVLANRGFPLPGGYFDMGRRLADSNGKIIVPCCRFLRLAGDTVVLQDTRRVGKDSLLLRIEYRNVHGMKPLAPLRELILYVDEAEEKRRQDYVDNYRLGRHTQQQEMPAIQIRDYGRIYKFYKDSFLFSIYKATPGPPRYYIVTGSRPAPPWGGSKMAVVDSGMSYVLQPRAGRDILDYNHQERLATIQRYNPATKRQEQMLVTPDADERVLLQLRRGNILTGYRWAGRVYAQVHVQDECDPGPSGALHYVTDSSGLPLPAFSGYKLMDTNPERLGAVRLPGQVRVTDTANRIGILRPDGSPAYPAINFRYTSLEHSVNGWFIASGGAAPGRQLLDSAGQSLLPEGMHVQSITPVNPALGYYGDGPAPDPVSGLSGLTVQNRAGTSLFMYIDRYGRLYYSSL